MKVYLIAMAIAVAGCSSQPMKTSFPDVPEKLMVKPEPLKKLNTTGTKISIDDISPSGVPLSTVTEAITYNYGLANAYLEQINSLQEWIRDQKRANP